MWPQRVHMIHAKKREKHIFHCRVLPGSGFLWKMHVYIHYYIYICIYNCTHTHIFSGVGINVNLLFCPQDQANSNSRTSRRFSFAEKWHVSSNRALELRDVALDTFSNQQLCGQKHMQKTWKIQGFSWSVTNAPHGHLFLSSAWPGAPMVGKCRWRRAASASGARNLQSKQWPPAEESERLGEVEQGQRVMPLILDGYWPLNSLELSELVSFIF